MRAARIVMALLVSAAAACARAPEWALAVEPLAPPTEAVSFSPQLTAHAGRVMLSWLQLAELRYILMFSERTPGGWSPARPVVEGATLVSNAADVPSVRALSDGTLAAHWLQRHGSNPEAYDSLLSWSSDGGLSWTPARTPHHDGTATQHGFTSIFEQPDGSVGVVWLDGRNTDPTLPEGQNGDMALWSATFDRGRSQTGEAPLSRRVCDCCQTSAAVTTDAALVAYRGRSADEIRDVHVVRRTAGGWESPVAVHQDGWQIHGCPVNGPAVDARQDFVAVAWFTGAGGAAQTYVAFSRNGGRAFADRVRVDDGGSTGHVTVAVLPDDAAVVAWTEVVQGRAELRVRRVAPDGSASRVVSVAEVVGTHYPRMVHSAGELTFAWTEMRDGFSHVRTARARIP